MIILDNQFLVLAAGPWTPSDFSSARVRIEDPGAGKEILVSVFANGEGPPIRFRAARYSLAAGHLLIGSGRGYSWMFRAVN